MPSRKILLLTAVCFLTFILAGNCPAQERRPSPTWLTRLNQELPLLGHRNWIAVVDSAYPLQTSTGIETIETDGDQLNVVRVVLHRIARTAHLRPVVFTDAELKAVPESDAPGVTVYREELTHFLDQFDDVKPEVQSLPHEEIISRLDEAGQKFHVLVLKTRMTIPYTSVFIRLDCGYWTDEQEKRLKERMGK